MDLARRVAELFSSDAPVEQLWDHLCELVRDSFHARSVTISVRTPGGERVAGDAGDSSHPLLRAAFAARSVQLDGTAAAAPLLFGSRSYGAMLVCCEQRLDARSAAFLESCALFVAARVHDEHNRLESDRYHALAYTDQLTQIGNRRAFDEALTAEWKRGSRSGTAMSLLMIDIDYFKGYNDRYGHQGGDRALAAVAQALAASSTREADLVARYGGEEFVVLLPDTPLEGAIAIAERCRAVVAARAIAHEGSSLGIVTLSIGAAALVPGADNDPQSLLSEADAALYRAKEGGRNRVAGGAYESDALPAQKTVAAERTNLPQLATRTIGRVRERAALLRDVPRSRLTTIVGAGGSGKTRMAVQVAHDLLESYPDGAWFVDLGLLASASSIVSAFSAALHLAIGDDECGTHALARALRKRDLLLVVDNCEHVAQAAAATIEALLDACPRVRVLATSRAPLGAPGEAVYRLPLLEREDAVALFAERARAAKPSFEITPASRETVERICALVDDIALGVELIASRVAIVSLEQLEQRLSQSFSIVASGRRASQPRHQTMRDLVAWSHDLLSEREQRLFRRLGIFAGGWTLEDMAAVCADDDLDPFALFDLHASLIDQSLVAENRADGEMRYRLLEPIREYAAERLDASAEQRALAQRHAAVFARRAAAADEAFYVTPSRAWFNAISLDLANYRKALDWCITQENDIPLGAAIAGSLSWYFYYSFSSEGVRWTRAALGALHPDDPPVLEARLRLALTPLYGLTPTEKRANGERAVRLYREIGDQARLSHALRMLGLTLAWYFPEDRACADELIDEAHAIATSLHDPIATALVLQARSQVLDAGDLRTRRALKEEAYDLLRRHGNDRQVSVVLTDLSEGAFAEGDESGALAIGRDALELAQLSGSRNTMLCAIINLAHYAAANADWAAAGEAGNQALRWSEESQSAEFSTFAINALACVAQGMGDPLRAARLFGFCNARFGVTHAPRHDGMSEDVLYRRTMERIRAQLPQAEIEAALREGAGWTEDQAIAQARYGSAPSNDSR